MENKELLEIVKEYKIGTKVINVGMCPVEDTIISLSPKNFDIHDIEITKDEIWVEGEVTNICIYSKGKWATIISQPPAQKQPEKSDETFTSVEMIKFAYFVRNINIPNEDLDVDDLLEEFIKSFSNQHDITSN